MYSSGLHSEEEEMKKLQQVVIFDEHELQEIINHEKHHAGMKRWLGFLRLLYEKQIFQHEQYFAKLLR